MIVAERTASTANLQLVPAPEEVYASAVAEHPEFQDFDKDLLLGTVELALGRMSLLEDAAREQSFDISPETAANISVIWPFAGTGAYDLDKPFKPQDNPRHTGEAWMGGRERVRLGAAARLGLKVAEAKSGHSIKPGPLSKLPQRLAEAKELMREYGPHYFYNGWPADIENLNALLRRPGTIVPAERVEINRDTTLQATYDQLRTFYFPAGADKSREVALVSDGAHLGGRVLHMAEHYKPFGDYATPYTVPTPTKLDGLRKFMLMESRGLLNYIFLAGVAAPEPHRFQLLPVAEPLAA